MQIPVSTGDHLWALGEHLITAATILAFCGRWIKKRFKQTVREAVREEISPLRVQIDQIYPWAIDMQKHFDPNSKGKGINGKAHHV